MTNSERLAGRELFFRPPVLREFFGPRATFYFATPTTYCAAAATWPTVQSSTCCRSARGDVRARAHLFGLAELAARAVESEVCSRPTPLCDYFTVLAPSTRVCFREPRYLLGQNL